MWFRSPIPKHVREILDALDSLPKGAKKFGGADGLCRAFAALIDHTLLKSEATPDDIRKLCKEAAKYQFATVFVNPCYVALAARQLEGKDVKVGSVAGFPLGSMHPDVKRQEAERGVFDGAHEMDMVVAIGALRAGDYDAVEEEIHAIALACHKRDAILKVILECAVLTEKEKRRGAKLAVRAGADFVKTSTGVIHAGATKEDVALLRDVVGRDLGVKASGGIRTLASALEMLAAGASRIGTSSGVAIVEELRAAIERK